MIMSNRPIKYLGKIILRICMKLEQLDDAGNVQSLDLNEAVDAAVEEDEV